MSDKPVIVHVIDNLGRGGAETLLVDLLPELGNHYDIVLVTLTDYIEFDPSEISCKHRYSLDYNYAADLRSLIGLFRAARKLKNIIKKHKPVLVRSQLYWSTMVARLACPKQIPLIFSVHITLSDGIFYFNTKGRLLKWMEQLTYKKRHIMVGVTQEVVDDYQKTIGIKGKSFVLHNYVKDAYFQHAIDYRPPVNGQLKIVAVGNPKKQKNYELVIGAFRLLKDPTVSCDIYGKSSYNEVLQKEIDKDRLPIYLKGKSPEVYRHLGKYDAYIMCSLFEGFGIAIAEAMAVGLPLFLSDLPVLREVSHGNAIFFNPDNDQQLKDRIEEFRSGKYDPVAMSAAGKEICAANYSRKGYVRKLLSIYEAVTGQ
jgi:glycosyltransferase involved in cell wall biosynthesis